MSFPNNVNPYNSNNYQMPDTTMYVDPIDPTTTGGNDGMYSSLYPQVNYPNQSTFYPSNNQPTYNYPTTTGNPNISSGYSSNYDPLYPSTDPMQQTDFHTTQFNQQQTTFIPQQQKNLIPFYPKNVVSRHAHDGTLKLLEKASNMTIPYFKSKNLNPPSFNPDSYSIPTQTSPSVKSKSTSPSSINLDFSDRSVKLFNSETHVNNTSTPGKKKKKKENDDSARLIIGLVGVVLAGIAAYFLGKSVAEGEDIEDDTLLYQELKSRWQINQASYDDSYRMDVDSVVKNMDGLLASKRKSRTRKIALLVLGFTAGGIGLAGSLVASKALMVTAVALGSITAIGLLFKLGYDLFSKREQKMAEAIDTSLNNLQQTMITTFG